MKKMVELSLQLQSIIIIILSKIRKIILYVKMNIELDISIYFSMSLI